MINKYRNQQ